MVTAPAFSIAPMLYSGVKSWSYFSNGYSQSNSFSKKAKPRLVQSKMLSASRCSSSDWRQKIAERHGAAARLHLVAHHGVRAGDEGGDVAGHPRRSVRTPRWPRRRATGVGSGVGELDTTCQCDGRRHGEREGRLEVGLLEDREHPAAVGDLELGVEVDLAVDRVDEAVQPLTGVHVCRGGVDRERVPLRGGRERDADAVEVRGRVERPRR